MEEQKQEQKKSFFEQFKELPLIFKRPTDWSQEVWREYQKQQRNALKTRLKGQFAIISAYTDPKTGKRMTTKPYVKALHDPATRTMIKK